MASPSYHLLGGLHSVAVVLKHAPETIRRAFVDQDRRDDRLLDVVAALAEHQIPIERCQRSRLDNLSELNHQGVLVEARIPADHDEKELRMAVSRLGSRAMFLVLDHVQDPHNLGACLRTADAAGCHGVIVAKDQSARLTPVVCKVASGAAVSVAFYRVTNLARTLQDLKRSGVWVYGADGDAEHTLFDVDLGGPVALVLGAEGTGLRRLTRDTCDATVSLPMHGIVESLNVSVAAGVLLYEVVRQRYRATSNPA